MPAPRVADDEDLGRIVATKKDAQKARNKKLFRLFLVKPGERRLSVDRLRCAPKRRRIERRAHRPSQADGNRANDGKAEPEHRLSWLGGDLCPDGAFGRMRGGGDTDRWCPGGVQSVSRGHRCYPFGSRPTTRNESTTPSIWRRRRFGEVVPPVPPAHDRATRGQLRADHRRDGERWFLEPRPIRRRFGRRLRARRITRGARGGNEGPAQVPPPTERGVEVGARFGRAEVEDADGPACGEGLGDPVRGEGGADVVPGLPGPVLPGLVRALAEDDLAPGGQVGDQRRVRAFERRERRDSAGGRAPPGGSRLG